MNRPKLGADRRRGGRRPGRRAGRAAGAPAAGREPLAVGGEHVEADDVVRRCGRSPGPASRRRCCRSSRRSCSGCASTGRGRSAARAAVAARCSVACTVPGCDGGGARPPGRADSTRLRCRAVSTTMPVPTALPAIDVPAPRMVSGVPVSPGDVDGGGELVDVPRADHDLRDDAVERGVGGVERPGQRRVVDVGDALAGAAPATQVGRRSPQLERAAQDRRRGPPRWPRGARWRAAAAA